MVVAIIRVRERRKKQKKKPKVQDGAQVATHTVVESGSDSEEAEDSDSSDGSEHAGMLAEDVYADEFGSGAHTDFMGAPLTVLDDEDRPLSELVVRTQAKNTGSKPSKTAVPAQNSADGGNKRQHSAHSSSATGPPAKKRK